MSDVRTKQSKKLTSGILRRRFDDAPEKSWQLTDNLTI